MALVITHTFQSTKSDGSHSDELQPSHWNADHTITGLPDSSIAAQILCITGETLQARVVDGIITWETV